jgi:hypothetical protein
MGNQIMEAAANGLPPSTYSVIFFPGSALPENYLNFVRSKWMRSLRRGNDYFELTDSDSYYKSYQRYIASLLSRRDAIIRLAVLTDEPDVALGFSLVEGNILHYVYVQREQREKGIARSLVPVKITTITHLTRAGMRIWNNKLSHCIFDPFA